MAFKFLALKSFTAFFLMFSQHLHLILLICSISAILRNFFFYSLSTTHCVYGVIGVQLPDPARGQLLETDCPFHCGSAGVESVSNLHSKHLPTQSSQG